MRYFARKARFFVDFQANSVTESVEEAEKAFFVAAGGESEFSQAAQRVIVRYGTSHSGLDHGFALVTDDFYSVKRLFDDFRRFAFDHSTGQVAVITGIVSVILGMDSLSSTLIIGAALGLVASFMSSAGDILENKKAQKESTESA